MSRLTKIFLLTLTLIPYIFFGIFELAFGILSMTFEKCMLPFRWINNKLIDISTKINTQQ
jgi:hypothetical protein